MRVPLLILPRHRQACGEITQGRGESSRRTHANQTNNSHRKHASTEPVCAVHPCMQKQTRPHTNTPSLSLSLSHTHTHTLTLYFSLWKHKACFVLNQGASTFGIHRVRVLRLICQFDSSCKFLHLHTCHSLILLCIVQNRVCMRKTEVVCVCVCVCMCVCVCPLGSPAG